MIKRDRLQNFWKKIKTLYFPIVNTSHWFPFISPMGIQVSDLVAKWEYITWRCLIPSAGIIYFVYISKS